MRSIKVIGFLLLLALWFPGVIANGAFPFSSDGVTSRTQLEVKLTQAKSVCEAQTFHQLRLQSTSGSGQNTPLPGLVRETQAALQRPLISETFTVVSPPNPTSFRWHILHSTEFPRAPSV